jgi:hypothetical protein
VENTALSSWAGTSNITTVGTVGTGTWQGTAIGASYISSDIARATGDDYTGTHDFSSSIMDLPSDVVQDTDINWDDLESISDSNINWQGIPKTFSISVVSPNDLTNTDLIGMIKNYTRDYEIESIHAMSDVESSLEVYRVGGTASAINWDDLEVIEPIDINTHNTGGVNWYEAYVDTDINWSDFETYDTLGINWQSGDAEQATINLKMWGK